VPRSARACGWPSEPARTVLDTLSRAFGLARCDLPFADVVGAALGLGWSRDPFDRLIAAQAELRGAELVSKDRTLRDHYARSVWD
jgi:PIN domain nuclease of toxin-antitoxin system